MTQRTLYLGAGAIVIVLLAIILISSRKTSTTVPSTVTAAQLQGEAKTGQIEEQQGQIISQQYPIINHLPQITDTYRIDFGMSQLHPANPRYVAIYVSSNDDTGKAAALAWMSSNGYNPANYEIIYQPYTK